MLASICLTFGQSVALNFNNTQTPQFQHSFTSIRVIWLWIIFLFAYFWECSHFYSNEHFSVVFCCCCVISILSTLHFNTKKKNKLTYNAHVLKINKIFIWQNINKCHLKQKIFSIWFHCNNNEKENKKKHM